MQPAPSLPPNDTYAGRLVQWFAKLDSLDSLKRPGRPPDQDKQVQDEHFLVIVHLSRIQVK